MAKAKRKGGGKKRKKAARTSVKYATTFSREGKKVGCYNKRVRHKGGSHMASYCRLV